MRHKFCGGSALRLHEVVARLFVGHDLLQAVEFRLLRLGVKFLLRFRRRPAAGIPASISADIRLFFGRVRYALCPVAIIIVENILFRFIPTIALIEHQVLDCALNVWRSDHASDCRPGQPSLRCELLKLQDFIGYVKPRCIERDDLPDQKNESIFRTERRSSFLGQFSVRVKDALGQSGIQPLQFGKCAVGKTSLLIDLIQRFLKRVVRCRDFLRGFGVVLLFGGVGLCFVCGLGKDSRQCFINLDEFIFVLRQLFSGFHSILKDADIITKANDKLLDFGFVTFCGNLTRKIFFVEISERRRSLVRLLSCFGNPIDLQPAELVGAILNLAVLRPPALERGLLLVFDLLFKNSLLRLKNRKPVFLNRCKLFGFFPELVDFAAAAVCLVVLILQFLELFLLLIIGDCKRIDGLDNAVDCGGSKRDDHKRTRGPHSRKQFRRSGKPAYGSNKPAD